MTINLDKTQNKLWISAGLKLVSGQSAQQVKEELSILQQETVKEEGCISFEVLHNKENPNLFTLWEEWINEDALKAHFNQAHTKAYLALCLTEVSYIEKLVKLT